MMHVCYTWMSLPVKEEWPASISSEWGVASQKGRCRSSEQNCFILMCYLLFWRCEIKLLTIRSKWDVDHSGFKSWTEMLCFIPFPIWLQNHIKSRWDEDPVWSKSRCSEDLVKCKPLNLIASCDTRSCKASFKAKGRPACHFAHIIWLSIFNFDSWSFVCKIENSWLEYWLMQFWHFPITEGRFDEITIYLYQQ